MNLEHHVVYTNMELSIFLEKKVGYFCKNIFVVWNVSIHWGVQLLNVHYESKWFVSRYHHPAFSLCDRLILFNSLFKISG